MKSTNNLNRKREKEMVITPKQRNKHKMKTFYAIAEYAKIIDYLSRENLSLLKRTREKTADFHYIEQSLKNSLDFYSIELHKLNTVVIQRILNTLLDLYNVEEKDKLRKKFQENIEGIRDYFLEISKLDVSSFKSLRLFQKELNLFADTFRDSASEAQKDGDEEKLGRISRKKGGETRSKSVGRIPISKFKGFGPSRSTMEFPLATNSTPEDNTVGGNNTHYQVKQEPGHTEVDHHEERADISFLEETLSGPSGVYNVRMFKGDIGNPTWKDQQLKLGYEVKVNIDYELKKIYDGYNTKLRKYANFRPPKGRKLLEDVIKKIRLGEVKKSKDSKELKLEIMKKSANFLKRFSSTKQKDNGRLVKRKKNKEHNAANPKIAAQVEIKDGKGERNIVSTKEVYKLVRVKRKKVKKKIITPPKNFIPFDFDNDFNSSNTQSGSRDNENDPPSIESKPPDEKLGEEILTKIQKPSDSEKSIYLKKLNFKRKFGSSKMSF